MPSSVALLLCLAMSSVSASTKCSTGPGIEGYYGLIKAGCYCIERGECVADPGSEYPKEDANCPDDTCDNLSACYSINNCGDGCNGGQRPHKCYCMTEDMCEGDGGNSLGIWTQGCSDCSFLPKALGGAYPEDPNPPEDKGAVDKYAEHVACYSGPSGQGLTESGCYCMKKDECVPKNGADWPAPSDACPDDTCSDGHSACYSGGTVYQPGLEDHTCYCTSKRMCRGSYAGSNSRFGMWATCQDCRCRARHTSHTQPCCGRHSAAAAAASALRPDCGRSTPAVLSGTHFEPSPRGSFLPSGAKPPTKYTAEVSGHAPSKKMKKKCWDAKGKKLEKKVERQWTGTRAEAEAKCTRKRGCSGVHADTGTEKWRYCAKIVAVRNGKGRAGFKMDAPLEDKCNAIHNPPGGDDA